MISNNYILGTGYFYNGSGKLDWFASLWLKNTFAYAFPAPERTIVIAVGNSVPPYPRLDVASMTPIDAIKLSGNMGHIHQYVGNSKPAASAHYHYCGVTSTFLSLASLAYANECDLVYKEQDCLAFGPWVQRLYTEIGDGGMIFGKGKLLSAQSLFLIRHWHLPWFIAQLVNQGSERDVANLPEHKFSRMALINPEHVKQFSFGYDRDRPYDIKDEVWYAQKFTPAELRQLSEAGLIERGLQIPDDVVAFTNDITDKIGFSPG